VVYRCSGYLNWITCSGIVDEEKAHLRGTMMQLIRQENAQVHTASSSYQLAVPESIVPQMLK